MYWELLPISVRDERTNRIYKISEIRKFDDSTLELAVFLISYAKTC
jgi:hypothetical protein